MINYSLSQRRNPQDPEGARKWYATAQSTGKAGVDELAQEIANATALTDADVVSAIRALVNRIVYHLNRGEIVQMETLGDFRVSISSEGVENEEDFNDSHIRSVRVIYTPGDRILSALQPANLTFRKTARRADVEAIGKDTSGEPQP